MALGVVLFLGSYVGYARYLGRVNGLPPLPEQYWPRGTRDVEPLKDRTPKLIARKLEQAFGRECPELRRPIKIEVPARGLLLVTREITFENDGRVKLNPVSVAVFGKNKGEDSTPEINTIRGNVAYLTFDRPIHQASDIANHKIVAGQVAGDILLVNNRRTLARDDDLTVDIRQGPLYYDQKSQRVWTEDFVKIIDAQSKPQANTISGKGMMLELITEQPARPGQARRPRQYDNITGIKCAHLRSTVDMNLHIDARSGFLSSKDTPAPGKAPADVKTSASPTGKDRTKPAAQQPEKALLVIKTQGPFLYDLQR